VVLLERLGTEGETARLQIAQVAEKIIDAANEQFIIKGEKFQISCSIGIVFFNDGSSDGNSILEQADQALYTIKREGKSNYYFHNRELSIEMQKQMELLERLRDESQAESFLPFYQPVLNTQSNLISGLQIFLRWQNPKGDIVEAHEIYSGAGVWLNDRGYHIIPDRAGVQTGQSVAQPGNLAGPAAHLFHPQPAGTGPPGIYSAAQGYYSETRHKTGGLYVWLAH